MLVKTKAFTVWGTPQEAQLNLNHSYPLKTIQLGGKRLLLNDFLSIVTCRAHVILDDTTKAEVDTYALETINKYGEKSYNPLNGNIKRCDNKLPMELCRAVVLYVVVSLMQGKSGIRSSVIDVLVEMLNAGLAPAFSSIENAQEELILSLLGLYDSFYTNEGEISSATALRRARVRPLESMLEHEGNTLLHGEYAFTGAACLVSSAAWSTSRAMDIIASLSCECVGAPSSAFDAEKFDVFRPQRGQMTAAAALRQLLESSGNATGTIVNSVPGCFLDIPQVNGPTCDMCVAAARAMEVELNSVQVGPLTGQATINPTQSRIALDMVLSGAKAAGDASCERVVALAERVGISPELPPAAPVSTGVMGAYYAVKRLSDALARELYLCCRRLEISEKTPVGQPGTNVASAVLSAKEVEGLTEAQIAKRKAKAEKAAAKAAAKAAKKAASSGGGLSEGAQFCSRLGSGTSLLKDHIIKAELFRSQDACFAALSPFCSTGESNAGETFREFCVSLLEKLESGGSGKRKAPKIPKGARDFLPDQMRIREQAFSVIRRVFKRHGAVEIDTPVFELKEVLTGKYGEDSKLIYDLADQGGELLSLRYDLTVPFARFLAMNSVGNIKRFHMAKVYRRDNPQITKGRYREFYQCDFDVAGTYRPMVPDAEVIAVATEILSELPIGDFIIKLNHRGILDAIFEISGVPAEKFRPICSAVDKLDKATWEEVKQEMVGEKGLDEAVADRIGEFVLHKGPAREMWSRLKNMNLFGEHVGANKAMDEMNILFDYLDAMGSLSFISFDMSLARGLDYYTGVIYEAVLTDGVSQMGSIAAGGRYDNLVGMFSASGQQTPCVGVSIGVERVFTIMERKAAESGAAKQHSDVQVYVASIGAGFVAQRMRVAKMLWRNNIPAEYSHLENPKFKKQLDEALERYIPVMIVFGEDEISKGVVKVKNMKEHIEVEVPLAENDLVEAVLKAGGKQVMATADLSLIDAMNSQL